MAGIAEQPWTYFMGTNGGGLWKTTDAGESWVNVSDGYYTSSSIGAIDVADSDPSIVYVGSGSTAIRGNVSPGTGMYKSTDGGESWTHVGLRDAGQIGRVIIHPRNPDIAHAAVLGHAFGPNEMRASSGPPTAARTGRRSSTSVSGPARTKSPWTPRTRTCSTRPCGPRSESPGP